MVRRALYQQILRRGEAVRSSIARNPLIGQSGLRERYAPPQRRSSVVTRSVEPGGENISLGSEGDPFDATVELTTSSEELPGTPAFAAPDTPLRSEPARSTTTEAEQATPAAAPAGVSLADMVRQMKSGARNLAAQPSPSPTPAPAHEASVQPVAQLPAAPRAPLAVDAAVQPDMAPAAESAAQHGTPPTQAPRETPADAVRRLRASRNTTEVPPASQPTQSAQRQPEPPQSQPRERKPLGSRIVEARTPGDDGLAATLAEQRRASPTLTPEIPSPATVLPATHEPEVETTPSPTSGITPAEHQPAVEAEPANSATSWAERLSLPTTTPAPATPHPAAVVQPAQEEALPLPTEDVAASESAPSPTDPALVQSETPAGFDSALPTLTEASAPAAAGAGRKPAAGSKADQPARTAPASPVEGATDARLTPEASPQVLTPIEQPSESAAIATKASAVEVPAVRVPLNSRAGENTQLQPGSPQAWAQRIRASLPEATADQLPRYAEASRVAQTSPAMDVEPHPAHATTAHSEPAGAPGASGAPKHREHTERMPGAPRETGDRVRPNLTQTSPAPAFPENEQVLFPDIGRHSPQQWAARLRSHEQAVESGEPPPSPPAPYVARHEAQPDAPPAPAAQSFVAQNETVTELYSPAARRSQAATPIASSQPLAGHAASLPSTERTNRFVPPVGRVTTVAERPAAPPPNARPAPYGQPVNENSPTARPSIHFAQAKQTAVSAVQPARGLHQRPASTPGTSSTRQPTDDTSHGAACALSEASGDDTHTLKSSPAASSQTSPARGTPQAWARRLLANADTEPSGMRQAQSAGWPPQSGDLTLPNATPLPSQVEGGVESNAPRATPPATIEQPSPISARRGRSGIPRTAALQPQTISSTTPRSHEQQTSRSSAASEPGTGRKIAQVPATRPASAMPLPQATRRALEPLVGFDPAGVRVYQGVAAARIAAAKNADAVAIGEDIYMAADRPAAAPENLGLLAHELTHVARTRDPHYTPPVLQDARPDVGGEEMLASSVEARVTAASQPYRNASTPASPSPEPASVHSRSLYASSSHDMNNGPGGGASEPAHNQWDGLPAPWEPLPAWMAPPLGAPVLDVATLPPSSPAIPTAQPAPSPGFTAATGTGGASRIGGMSAAGGDSESGGSGGDGGAQAAEKNRSLPPATSSAPPPPPPTERAEPERDLDALAKQVYAVLKRRLAAERRRSGT
jgi:hypothetical protein